MFIEEVEEAIRYEDGWGLIAVEILLISDSIGSWKNMFERGGPIDEDEGRECEDRTGADIFSDKQQLRSGDAVNIRTRPPKIPSRPLTILNQHDNSESTCMPPTLT